MKKLLFSAALLMGFAFSASADRVVNGQGRYEQPQTQGGCATLYCNG